MPTVDQLMAELERFRGQPYVYGAEVSTSKDPTGVGPVDCSELTSVAARRVGIGASVPDGAYNQAVTLEQHGMLGSASEAIRHRGHLLFYDDGTGTGRDRVTHVAVAVGDGATTFEARSESYPVGNQPYAGRKFTTGGPIPGLDYGGATPAPQPPSDEWDAGMRTLAETDPRMKGDDVKAAQYLLLDWGFIVGGGADGVYGPGTAQAVREFQASRGLVVDGAYGSASRRKANGG